MTSTDDAPEAVPAHRAGPAGDRTAHGSTDRISVLGIEAFGHHGVLGHERRDGQRFLADVVLGVDTRAAASSDDLRDTVDYGSLVANVRTAIESDPVDLIETLAQRIVWLCLADERVDWAEVTVHKPHAPVQGPVSDVTVTVARTRADVLPFDQPERSRA